MLAWGGGGKRRCDGKQRSKPRAVPKFPVIFFFLRTLHPKQPHLLRVPSRAGLYVCIMGLRKTSTKPIIFDGSWVFGHDAMEA